MEITDRIELTDRIDLTDRIELADRIELTDRIDLTDRKAITVNINSQDTKNRGEYCIVKSIGDGSNGPHREVVAAGILAGSVEISAREEFERLEPMHCVPVDHRERGWRGACYGWLFAGLVPTSVRIKFSPKGADDGTRGQRWVLCCKPI
eukprot:g6687.t1